MVVWCFRSDFVDGRCVIGTKATLCQMAKGITMVVCLFCLFPCSFCLFVCLLVCFVWLLACLLPLLVCALVSLCLFVCFFICLLVYLLVRSHVFFSQFFFSQEHDRRNPHPNYEKPRMQCDQFIVKHFAGCVTYNVSGFLNKNNDSLQVTLPVWI